MVCRKGECIGLDVMHMSKDNSIQKCLSLKVDGIYGKGRLRKMRDRVVRTDLRMSGLIRQWIKMFGNMRF